MTAKWSQNLFNHARYWALQNGYDGATVVMGDGLLANLIAAWPAPGPVLAEDVRMIVMLSLLTPPQRHGARPLGPPQHLRDWLLEERIGVAHRNAPPFEQRVRNIVIAFGLARARGYWEPPPPPAAPDPLEASAIAAWGAPAIHPPMWESAKQCLARLHISPVVKKVDRDLHLLFPNTRTPYIPHAADWLADKMIGLEQEFPRTRLEICSRAGVTEFHISRHRQTFGKGLLGQPLPVKIQALKQNPDGSRTQIRVPVRWMTTGATRQFAGGVDFVWTATPRPGSATDAFVCEEDPVRISGPVFITAGGLDTAVPVHPML